MTRRNFIKRFMFTMIAAIMSVSIFGIFRRTRQVEQMGDSAAARPKSEIDQTEQPTMAVTGPLLSFFIIRDLHIASGLSSQSDHLRKALDDIQTFGDQVDTIIITGDLTDSGSEADYTEYKKIMSQNKLPTVYANMGNHDYYNVWMGKDGWSQETFPNSKTDAMAREAFTTLFNQEKPYRSVQLNGFQIILLSQEAYIQEKPEVGEGAWYSDQQMDWFQSKMAENKDSKPVFVMIHQELPPIGSDGGNHTLIKAKQFRDFKTLSECICFFGAYSSGFYDKHTTFYKRNFSLVQKLVCRPSAKQQLSTC